jgi:hypothetical protein
MMKYFLSLGLVVSLNSFAGYECKFSLAHVDDLNKILAEKIIKASDTDMRSDIIKDLVVESKKERSQTSIELKTFVVGWSGEEEISFATFRRDEQRLIERDVLLEKITIRGDAHQTLWFDSYKLNTSCSIT